jgi:hypothetical protein
MKRIAMLLLLALPYVVTAQVTNIAGTSASSATRESLRVPLNGVVHVQLPSGQRALIQFTAIGENSATYHWVYKNDASSRVETGVGTVVEKYERLPAQAGRSSELLPLAGHDTIVRAGSIRAEWSKGGFKFCYFYFNPDRAKAILEPSAQFEAGL